MRPFLALIAGGPGRVSISAAAIVAIVFVLAGAGWDLARAAWHASLFASGFVFVWAVLAIVGNAAGVADDTTPSATAAKEASRD
ncbi:MULTISPECIES: hypothetical protein [Methylobacterium]|uniref:Uncharacterized protein n=2 Tax=Methylobacterium TaxID=407 RepID=A0ABQ4SUJ1_9HYPH|nr:MULTISPECIES: hypothetical protein [Methylobacterium]PIU05519.1 MAG: hypothetical protein COT56_14080 [Methylobacterium sp. CG09_land_8_20_14_0_10_71_15]PIU13590.1 MAG: hypothetical protein COT28_10860 [Methylobacterium sp. CG08_land_8_20_14_0_20_71_15]GBU17023.1 hypothetical protein AwMethylo_12380 [Methylobacterium sp.]GJD91152.1 hypothetical protein BHAOGJBA_4700 [Methylobacterium hispanicum]GJE06887.1 hypothetical protein AOPFMNJM_2210 [Methylobacterium jeotgali]